MNLHQKHVFPGAMVLPTCLAAKNGNLGQKQLTQASILGETRSYGSPSLLCTPVSLLLALASPPIYPPPPPTTILIMAALCFSSSCLPPPSGKL